MPNDGPKNSRQQKPYPLEYRFWRLRPTTSSPPVLPLTANNLLHNAPSNASQAQEEGSQDDTDYEEFLKRAIAPSDSSSHTNYRAFLKRVLAEPAPSTRSRSSGSRRRFHSRQKFMDPAGYISKSPILNRRDTASSARSLHRTEVAHSSTILSGLQNIDGKRQIMLEHLLQAEQVQNDSATLIEEMVEALRDYVDEASNPLLENEDKIRILMSYFRGLNKNISNLKSSYSELDQFLASLVAAQWEIMKSEENVYTLLAGKELPRNDMLQQEEEMLQEKAQYSRHLWQQLESEQPIQANDAFLQRLPAHYMPIHSNSSQISHQYVLEEFNGLEPVGHDSYDAVLPFHSSQTEFQDFQDTSLSFIGSRFDLVDTITMIDKPTSDKEVQPSARLQKCRYYDIEAVFKSIEKNNFRRPEIPSRKQKQGRRAQAEQRIVHWELGSGKHSWLDLCRIAFIGKLDLEGFGIYMLASFWRRTWFMHKVTEDYVPSTPASGSEKGQMPPSWASSSPFYPRTSVQVEVFHQNLKPGLSSGIRTVVQSNPLVLSEINNSDEQGDSASWKKSWISTIDEGHPTSSIRREKHRIPSFKQRDYHTPDEARSSRTHSLVSSSSFRRSEILMLTDTFAMAG